MDSVRAFIAIDLPENLRRGLTGQIDRLRDALTGIPIRWVRPEAIHLSLRFLGDTDLAQVLELKQGLEGLVGAIPVFSISVGGLGCFPNPQRPRVVWMGIQEASGTLVHLQQKVEAMCAQLGVPREKRGYSPHLTLGRIRPGGESKAAGELGRVMMTDGVEHLGVGLVDEVVLFQSELKPDGAVYSRLASVRLRGR